MQNIEDMMEYTLGDTTVLKFYQFGTNVFGIDVSMKPMEVVKKSIELVKEFLFNTLGLKSTFTEIGIDESNFAVMVQKACMNGVLPGFKSLNKQDIENIFRMCL